VTSGIVHSLPLPHDVFGNKTNETGRGAGL
jgi:hypothetical protein